MNKMLSPQKRAEAALTLLGWGIGGVSSAQWGLMNLWAEEGLLAHQVAEMAAVDSVINTPEMNGKDLVLVVEVFRGRLHRALAEDVGFARAVEVARKSTWLTFSAMPA
jgi:hypothetical protein